jgi:hypothetical protein
LEDGSYAPWRAEKTEWKNEWLLAIKLLLEGELDIAAVGRFALEVGGVG